MWHTDGFMLPLNVHTDGHLLRNSKGWWCNPFPQLRHSSSRYPPVIDDDVVVNSFGRRDYAILYLQHYEDLVVVVFKGPRSEFPTSTRLF